MNIQTIGVVGCGLMGSGIAEVCARAGFDVIVAEADDERLAAGLERVRQSLQRGVSRGKIAPAEAEAALGRLRGTVHLEDFRPADLVIEAVTEDLNIKKAVFRRLDAILRPEVIIASNTSSLSIAALAAETQRPDRVLGMHFFNPVPVMKLVEIIKAAETSPETLEVTRELTGKLGKEYILVNESPLFAVNRILVPMLNEAMFVLMEGVASAQDIDKGMMLGANHPIGPLALCDLIGLDVMLMVTETLYQETGDSKYRPCPLLRKMVRAGHLGRKTGRGFYVYNQ